MTAAPAHASRFAFYNNWSLRRRVGRWFIALVALLVIAFATVLVALLYFKQKGDDVIDRWQPAYTVSQTVLIDLVNEETGLRGYVIGKQDVFLQPYTQYSASERTDQARLRTLLGGRSDLLGDLDNFTAAAKAWHDDVANPYIARVQNNDPSASSLVTDLAGKASFDKVRAAAATLSANIRTVREDAKEQRVTAMTYCLVAAGVAAFLTLGSKYLLWRGLRRSVLQPIEAIGVQTREVALGDLDKQIVASGPPEIADLGRDVETMRARIANELARVDRARVMVIERSAELARSNADLEQFAYVASHDLSEPLRKVANFCQLLERQYGPQLDDKAKQYIAFAVDGAKRMQVLIGDLLSFSRVGRSTEEFAPVDTDHALSRALANLDDRIVSADAEIVRGELPTVPGDSTLLVALMQNLVGNSLKYHSADRTPRIEIGAEKRGTDWLFTISDNGIGIDAQYAERIFTIFQRLHLRDQYGGTGIGLALCRKIVEFHRGKIWLGENNGAPGATFHFTIPDQIDARDMVDADEY